MNGHWVLWLNGNEERKNKQAQHEYMGDGLGQTKAMYVLLGRSERNGKRKGIQACVNVECLSPDELFCCR